MFKYTTAIKKLRKLKKRKKIVQGGTSAGKTFGILPILINKAIIEPNLEISIVSESIPHLRRGALKDFEKIMRLTNRWIDTHFNRTLLKYTFSNGSYIEFFSVEQDDKLRGARRHILYINEANNVSLNAYNELSIRTSQDIWLDFNPTSEFWAHTEVAPDDDSEMIILTYLDNEGLPQTIVEDIERKKEKAKTSDYWANWWKVYGLGEIGSLQGVVFNNWKTIDSLPSEARLLGIGMDFGYSNDPTAIVEIYKYNDKRILNEVCYQKGLVNSDIANRLPDNVTIYADSAEPKSIEEIKRTPNRTIRIAPATKGKDSINYGIDIMQQQEYLVTKSSTNIIKELRGYLWATDKTGATLNKPIDDFNHAIDAIRYHEMESLGIQKNYGTICNLLKLTLNNKMEFVIKIPKSLKEVKLNDFLQFSKLEGSDERLVMYKAFEVFTNLEKEHVKQLPYDVANQTLKAVLNLLKQKPQDRRTFFIGDVEYGRIPNMETITFGEYIELDTFITPLFHGEIDSEYAFKFMSCLYRPIKEKVRDIYSIEPFTKEYLDSEHWEKV